MTVEKGVKLRDKVGAPVLNTAGSDKKHIDEIQRIINLTKSFKLLKIKKDWKPKGDEVIACD